MSNVVYCTLINWQELTVVNIDFVMNAHPLEIWRSKRANLIDIPGITADINFANWSALRNGETKKHGPLHRLWYQRTKFANRASTRALSLFKCGIFWHWISLIKIRPSWDRLIFILGISVLVRRHIQIETDPWMLCTSIEINCTCFSF